MDLRDATRGATGFLHICSRRSTSRPPRPPSEPNEAGEEAGRGPRGFFRIIQIFKYLKYFFGTGPAPHLRSLPQSSRNAIVPLLPLRNRWGFLAPLAPHGTGRKRERSSGDIQRLHQPPSWSKSPNIFDPRGWTGDDVEKRCKSGGKKGSESPGVSGLALGKMVWVELGSFGQVPGPYWDQCCFMSSPGTQRGCG